MKYQLIFLITLHGFPAATTFEGIVREQAANGNWYVEEPREIDILDRIGGGDGFSGGLLYAILSKKPEKEWNPNVKSQNIEALKAAGYSIDLVKNESDETYVKKSEKYIKKYANAK